MDSGGELSVFEEEMENEEMKKWGNEEMGGDEEMGNKKIDGENEEEIDKRDRDEEMEK